MSKSVTQNYAEDTQEKLAYQHPSVNHARDDELLSAGRTVPRRDDLAPIICPDAPNPVHLAALFLGHPGQIATCPLCVKLVPAIPTTAYAR